MAATNLAHEFGHVNYMVQANGILEQKRRSLMILYQQIHKSNSGDHLDSRLVELTGKMGGTPIEIGQDQEHWAEANALRFLRERIPGGKTYRVVYRMIEKTLTLHAGNHIERSQ